MLFTPAIRQSATKAARSIQAVSPAISNQILPPHLYRLAPQQSAAVILPDVFTPRPDATDLAEAAAALTAQAVASFSTFTQTRDISALSRAIALQREALTNAPVAVASQLSNMGSFLAARYSMTKSMANLESSIELKQRSLDLTPTNDAERASRLANLAVSFGLRFQATKSEADLDRASELLEQAVAATSKSSPLRLNRLVALATALTGKAELPSIERGIIVAEEGLRLAEDVVKQSELLGLLSFLFAARSKAAAAPADLQKAMELAEEALRLIPATHAERPARLSQLASVLRQKWAVGFHDVPLLQRSYALEREAKKLRTAA